MSKVAFFGRERSSASLRISTSSVFRPSWRSSSRMRLSISRTSRLLVTSSSPVTATLPPSSISRRQRYKRLGATPLRRATIEMLSRPSSVSSTILSFSAALQ
jgi:hypothetical protein